MKKIRIAPLAVAALFATVAAAYTYIPPGDIEVEPPGGLPIIRFCVSPLPPVIPPSPQVSSTDEASFAITGKVAYAVAK
jgi:hypothetical protein